MTFDHQDPMSDTSGPWAARPGIVDFRVRVPVGLYPAPRPPRENIERYQTVLGSQSSIENAPDLDDLLGQMDANEVAHAVMHAEYESGDPVRDLNRAVADVVAKHPDRFTGIGTISLPPNSIKHALDQVDECIALGMVGISLQPGFFGLDITDKKLYPIYARAEEADLIVALHTGINYTTNRPMAREHPMQLDELCCDFNDLTVIASHAGWPWVSDMVAVARRHPNVFVEFGGMAPRYVTETGSGWEVMHRFMNSLLSRQALFATDWPVMSHQRAISEWLEAELKPEVLQALLAGNARELLAKRRPDLDAGHAVPDSTTGPQGGR